MDKIQKKICAVIVTFNRKELLLKNINMCLKQSYKLDLIMIVDNHSTDGTQEYIDNNITDELKPQIKYIYKDSNTGGAGGFAYGVQCAKNMGFDYILLMDDDGHPADYDTVKHIMEYVEKEKLEGKSIFLNSLVICSDDDLSFGLFQENKIVYKKNEIKTEFVKNFCNPFNGTLLSKELLNEIGIPREDYFIKGDEKEYLARAISHKAYIGTVTNSLYWHPTPFKNVEEKNILGVTFKNNLEAEWKEYYNVRNTFVNNKLYSSKPLRNNVRFLFGRMIKVMLYSHHKSKMLRTMLLGAWHAKKNKMGIVLLPGNKRVG